MIERLKQHEQVIKVMVDNGGYATLGFLYQHVDVSGWATKTPFRSINRIVQDSRFFFKIKPGLWALKEMKDEVLKKFLIQDAKEQKLEEFNHTYFQGLLVEIGNVKGYKTYTPRQDKNRLFLDKSLGSISTIDSIFQFSYDFFVKRAKTVDVIWFNERDMPYSFFEVEHSTDIYNSLIKFSDLKDFYSNFCIVADEARRREYHSKLSSNIFKDIQNRIEFMSYDVLSIVHTNTYKLFTVNKDYSFL